MSVLLVERLSQMLGTPYHRSACGASASTTTPRTQMDWMPMVAVGMTRMGCRAYHLALPILMYRVCYCPLLMISRMSCWRLNVLVFILCSFSRPRDSLVCTSRVNDVLLLEMRMSATCGHILQEVVMHVIGVILIGRWLFASWRVTWMWSDILNARFRLSCNVHHIALGLYLSQ